MSRSTKLWLSTPRVKGDMRAGTLTNLGTKATISRTSARGLGDPETTLTKFHPVCPAYIGKQPIARWYFPPEVDYRLSLLPPNSKGLVVWIIEAKVLSKAESQFLALLPSLRPRVRVIVEYGESSCGNHLKKLQDYQQIENRQFQNDSQELSR